MNREQQLYQNIMHEIAFVEQQKPLLVQIKELYSAFINIWNNLFSFSYKIVLTITAIFCFAINGIDFSSDESLQTSIYYSYYDSENSNY